MRKSFAAVVSGFAFLSLVIAGCAAAPDPGPEDAVLPEPTTEITPEPGAENIGTSQEALSDGSVACVDQSYASAFRLPDWYTTPSCSTAWNTTLSRNHKVSIILHCSSTYVYVKSQWNPGKFYVLRQDALRRC